MCVLQTDPRSHVSTLSIGMCFRMGGLSYLAVVCVQTGASVQWSSVKP